MSRIVVVGAGVGGLAAAVRLAAAGHRVTVCERSERVGGNLTSWSFDGFRFDTGPSLLTMPFVFEELFAETGAPLSQVLRLEKLDPIARYRFADGTVVDACAGPDRLSERFTAAFGGAAGADWQRLYARAERIWRASYEPFLASPLHGVRSLLALARRADDLLAVAPWKTLHGLGAHYLHDPRLRMFLDRYATYAGSDPRRAPAALAAIPYAEQQFGAWYVAGGLHRLAEALRQRAADHGATVRTGVEVAAITLTGNRVSGVRLVDGAELPADLVVSDVDAAVLYGRLLPRASGVPAVSAVSVVSRLGVRRQQRSLSGFVLLLGVRGATPQLAHHNVFFPENYGAEFDALFGREPAPVPDPAIFVSAPRDPETAPPGHDAWFVLVNAPPHGPVDWDDATLAERYADHVLATLAARGLDVRDRVLFRQVITPADRERLTGAPGGAIYGYASHGARAAFLRPANRSPVPGLYLVGGSAHPGGGLPLVALSARIVAGLIGPA